jgi:hypothetical protein
VKAMAQRDMVIKIKEILFGSCYAINPFRGAG